MTVQRREAALQLKFLGGLLTSTPSLVLPVLVGGREGLGTDGWGRDRIHSQALDLVSSV